MKKNVFIILLISITANAQLSIGLNAGTQQYRDQCSSSEALGQAVIGLYYAFNEYLSIRPNVNAGYLHNTNYGYNTDFLRGDLDFLVNANSVLGFKDNKVRLSPYIGTGYGRYENQNVHSLKGGLLAQFKIIDRLWFSLEAGRNGFMGLNPIGGQHQTTVKGISGYQDFAVAGLVFDITKRKVKPKQVEKLIEKHIIKEKCCDQDVKVYPQQMVIPNEVVLFDEGSSKIGKDQLAAIIKMTDYLESNPNLKIELVGAACGGQGSPERNLELSEARAKSVYDKMASLRGNDYSRLSYRGVGVDTKYTNKGDIDANKRTNFVIYK